MLAAMIIAEHHSEWEGFLTQDINTNNILAKKLQGFLAEREGGDCKAVQLLKYPTFQAAEAAFDVREDPLGNVCLYRKGTHDEVVL